MQSDTFVSTTTSVATFTSYQVNVDSLGNNIIGDAANEPSIVVDPTNPNRMAIGWRQFDSVASNFRQAGRAYTTNGGASWVAGTLEANVFRSDPVLASDGQAGFFYLNIQQYTSMWRSLDGGQSWFNLAFATGGDKEWFTIDKTNSSGHGFQYQCWSPGAASPYGDGQFSRSTNGGSTWMTPIAIPNAPQWGTLDVDTSGNLFVGGVNGTTNQVWCVRSTNAKRSSWKVSFDQSAAVNLGGVVLQNPAINPVGLAGQVFLAVDRSGTSTNNNIYMLASVQPAGSTGTDVMFVRSTDGGLTFSAPKRINDDAANPAAWHWFGTFSVAPNGRIDCAWLDTRNSNDNLQSQLFYSYSRDGGVTWAPNIAVSNSFDPTLGYPNQNKIGDYFTMVSDNTGTSVAYPATFNSEQDIYYVRITPPPVPDYSISITPASVTVPRTGGNASYTISVSPTGGFNSQVNLSISGLPAGASSTFTPNPTPDYSTLSLSVPSNTSAGSYLFTVTGTGGSPTVTRSATATLVKAKR